ncbi:hypothetical protein FHT40_002429 [Mycolicibacterium sp. BK556]|uniref:hypothetical protein n=1 Tax=unclassified Mycolicibacterium TaxID=2636767 RepID=UPI0016106747|nr:MULTISPECIES: hypothetical protein [unclassified Mycolicibacterium]MBB3602768.1 hypothetical protein [Mycolicibacterium sp. BK556]MBB3632963.1 hypothetical protein [Mycolicibacterium sp. BK607]
MKSEKMRLPRASMSITRNLRYPGGYGDEHVEDLAVEDGQATVHKPSVFGENTHPHAVDVLNAAHGTNTGLIAHDYRGNAQTVVEEIESGVPQAVTAEEITFTALETWRHVQVNLITLRHELTSRGLPIPSPFLLWWIVGGIVVLFFGETPLISNGYQVFGLSDRPLIPYVGLTDELHLVAYGSVGALLMLAHFAGEKLRLIAYDVQQRRLAVTEEAKATLPSASKFDAVVAGGCVVFAAAVLVGLAMIRADYLREDGTDARTLPFFLIQVGIFAAAVGLSYRFTHPYGKRWATATKAAKKADKALATNEGAFNAMVSAINGNIDLLDTLLAQSGHHVGVSESDTRRQTSLYVRRAILSQPEPTRERLFPAQLPQTTEHLGEDLNQFLTGITAVPTFEKLSTDSLAKRHAEIRVELRALDDRLRAIRSGDDAKPGPRGEAP